jgi:hypothetical protein
VRRAAGLRHELSLSARLCRDGLWPSAVTLQATQAIPDPAKSMAMRRPKLVVKIDGREAIPLRAVPFLTDWCKWTPGVLARVLAGIGGGTVFVFGELTA